MKSHSHPTESSRFLFAASFPPIFAEAPGSTHTSIKLFPCWALLMLKPYDCWYTSPYTALEQIGPIWSD